VAGGIVGVVMLEVHPVLAAIGAAGSGGLVGAISPISGPLAASISARSATLRSGEVTGHLPAAVLAGVICLVLAFAFITRVTGYAGRDGLLSDRTLLFPAAFALLGALGLIVACIGTAVLRVGRPRRRTFAGDDTR
jgi:hypothetical protein